MARPFRFAGEIFDRLHRELVGTAIAFDSLDPSRVPPERLEVAQRTWERRAQAEFRSIQILARFLTEVVGAGDPVDVYAGVLDAIGDEVRQCALSIGVCRALGVEAMLPTPVELDERPATADAPIVERALYTAIGMLGVNETLSAGFVADLYARCDNAVIRAVLAATAEREPERAAFRWRYIELSLGRFPPDTLNHWRAVTRAAVRSQTASMQPLLDAVPEDRRSLADWPDEGRAELGLFSQERQALVFQQTLREALEPRLRALRLW
jgi:hypothetical protein